MSRGPAPSVHSNGSQRPGTSEKQACNSQVEYLYAQNENSPLDEGISHAPWPLLNWNRRTIAYQPSEREGRTCRKRMQQRSRGASFRPATHVGTSGRSWRGSLRRRRRKERRASKVPVTSPILAITSSTATTAKTKRKRRATREELALETKAKTVKKWPHRRKSGHLGAIFGSIDRETRRDGRLPCRR